MLGIATASLAVGIGLAGWREGRRLQAARRRVPIRVHVNGTRGKSDVTRLIAAGLRSAGVETLAKVTGTEARWILPSGEEKPVRRKGGRARIQEQAEALLLAAQLGCSALVVECMALHPELQWASEHQILKSTVGVITNARLDHAALMGWEQAAVAKTLANTVPTGATLVCGDGRVAAAMEAIAAARGTRIVVPPSPDERHPLCFNNSIGFHRPWQNVALAMTVLGQLGVDLMSAQEGLRKEPPPRGAVTWTLGAGAAAPGAVAVVLHALAVNDPESLEIVMQAAVGAWVPPQVAFVYHHRHDRGDRAVLFGKFFERAATSGYLWPRTRGASRLHGIWISGQRLPRYGFPRAPIRGFAASPDAVLRGQLRLRPCPPPAGQEYEEPRGGLLVVLCGNTRGALGWEEQWEPWRPVAFPPHWLPAGADGEEVGEGGVAWSRPQWP